MFCFIVQVKNFEWIVMIHFIMSQKGKEIGEIQYDFDNNTENAKLFRRREKILKYGFIIFVLMFIPFVLILDL